MTTPTNWKALQRALDNHPQIDSWSDERNTGDGFWAYTKRGYANLMDEPHGGFHTIHESTVREVWRRVREIGPCACKECA